MIVLRLSGSANRFGVYSFNFGEALEIAHDKAQYSIDATRPQR